MASVSEDVLPSAAQEAEVVAATFFRHRLLRGGAANRAAVRAVAGADLDLVGIAMHGPKNAVDKVVKGARMHP